MTTCLATATPLQRANDRRTYRAALTPAGKPACAVGSRLLRVLTGADSIRLPHHPRRRRPRRF
jgi:hypothetical protein